MKKTVHRTEHVLLFVPNLIGQIFLLVLVDFSPYVTVTICFAKGAFGANWKKDIALCNQKITSGQNDPLLSELFNLLPSMQPEAGTVAFLDF